MLRLVIFVLPLTLSLAIRVPVGDENSTAKPTASVDKKQDTFYVSDDVSVDSYLIPPDPHRPAEVIPDVIITPATYLLPPSPEKHVDYYAPVETGEQTDWYPIHEAQAPSSSIDLPPRESDLIPILVPNQETPKPEADRFIFTIPSRQLEPPLENEQSYHVPKLVEDHELPLQEINQPFRNRPNFGPKLRKKPKKYSPYIEDSEPTLSLDLTPPKIHPEPLKYVKNPTKLYPKKVNQEFHPIPIPLSQFEDTSGVPRALPVNLFTPDTKEDIEYFTPTGDKKIYLYEQAEQKRRLKGKNQVKPKQAADTPYVANISEQEASETMHRHPGHPGQGNMLHGPIRQQPAPAPAPPPQPAKPTAPPPPPPGERTEFRMHGMKGPNSYQFGYDTGKGKNRQFRFEERDDDGRVKGHYGYMDQRGKMRVVNYGADPEHGFHAESPQDTEEPAPQTA